MNTSSVMKGTIAGVRPMPVNWSIDPDNRVVAIRYVDPYTADEWRDALSTVIRDEAFERGFGFLIDRRFAAAPTEQFARAVASFVSAHREQLADSRVAIVVSTTFGYGMGRLQEALNETAGLASRAFTSEEAARDWLSAPS
jgi:hypothetical protein